MAAQKVPRGTARSRSGAHSTPITITPGAAPVAIAAYPLPFPLDSGYAADAARPGEWLRSRECCRRGHTGASRAGNCATTRASPTVVLAHAEKALSRATGRNVRVSTGHLPSVQARRRLGAVGSHPAAPPQPADCGKARTDASAIVRRAGPLTTKWPGHGLIEPVGCLEGGQLAACRSTSYILVEGAEEDGLEAPPEVRRGPSRGADSPIWFLVCDTGMWEPHDLRRSPVGLRRPRLPAR